MNTCKVKIWRAPGVALVAQARLGGPGFAVVATENSTRSLWRIHRGLWGESMHKTCFMPSAPKRPRCPPRRAPGLPNHPSEHSALVAQVRFHAWGFSLHPNKTSAPRSTSESLDENFGVRDFKSRFQL
jgi:hypothetical protein